MFLKNEPTPKFFKMIVKNVGKYCMQNINKIYV